MIREVTREDIPVCVNLIKKSFKTVADEYGFTEENAPRFTACICHEHAKRRYRQKKIYKDFCHRHSTRRYKQKNSPKGLCHEHATCRYKQKNSRKGLCHEHATRRHKQKNSPKSLCHECSNCRNRQNPLIWFDIYRGRALRQRKEHAKFQFMRKLFKYNLKHLRNLKESTCQTGYPI